MALRPGAARAEPERAVCPVRRLAEALPPVHSAQRPRLRREQLVHVLVVGVGEALGGVKGREARPAAAGVAGGPGVEVGEGGVAVAAVPLPHDCRVRATAARGVPAARGRGSGGGSAAGRRLVLVTARAAMDAEERAHVAVLGREARRRPLPSRPPLDHAAEDHGRLACRDDGPGRGGVAALDHANGGERRGGLRRHRGGAPVPWLARDEGRARRAGPRWPQTGGGHQIFAFCRLSIFQPSSG